MDGSHPDGGLDPGPAEAFDAPAKGKRIRISKGPAALAGCGLIGWDAVYVARFVVEVCVMRGLTR